MPSSANAGRTAQQASINRIPRIQLPRAYYASTIGRSVDSTEAYGRTGYFGSHPDRWVASAESSSVSATIQPIPTPPRHVRQLNSVTAHPRSRPPQHRAFASFSNGDFRIFFFTATAAMMADNIEHVISYWVIFQKFHSPALGGFAVVSHWLPFLMFSVASGALAERFDPRRVIQCGMALFIIASLSWAYFFFTDSLQMWQAMAILVLHGCAGVLWQTPNQMLLYDIVGPAELESGVRLNAMARYLAVLAGPAVGAAILLAFGPAWGIMLNTVFYLPLVLWLIAA